MDHWPSLKAVCSLTSTEALSTGLYSLEEPDMVYRAEWAFGFGEATG